jgi:hypothetical protein
MPRTKRQTFSGLSARERKVVGVPDDYEWGDATDHPPRPRTASVQFSLRVERSVLEGLQHLATATATSVSEVARDALERYLESGGRPAISNIHVSFPLDAGIVMQVEGGHAELSRNRFDRPAIEPRVTQSTGTY